MRRYLPMSELLIPYSLIFIWDMSRYLAISQLLTSQWMSNLWNLRRYLLICCSHVHIMMSHHLGDGEVPPHMPWIGSHMVVHVRSQCADISCNCRDSAHISTIQIMSYQCLYMVCWRVCDSISLLYVWLKGVCGGGSMHYFELWTSFLEHIICYAIVLVSRAAPTHVFVRVCRLFSVGDCRPNFVYPLDLHWHVVIVYWFIYATHACD